MAVGTTPGSADTIKDPSAGAATYKVALPSAEAEAGHVEGVCPLPATLAPTVAVKLMGVPAMRAPNRGAEITLSAMAVTGAFKGRLHRAKYAASMGDPPTALALRLTTGF